MFLKVETPQQRKKFNEIIFFNETHAGVGTEIKTIGHRHSAEAMITSAEKASGRLLSVWIFFMMETSAG